MTKEIYSIIRGKNRSTLISCGTWIPKNWKYVIVEVQKFEENSVTVKFRKADVVVK